MTRNICKQFSILSMTSVLPFFSVLLLSVFISFANMSSVGASFDYGVATTTTPQLGGGSTCSQIGTSSSSTAPFSSGNTPYYTNDWYYSNGGHSALDAMAADFAANLPTGSGWGAYYTNPASDGGDGGGITFITFDPSTAVTLAPYLVSGSPYPGAYKLNFDHLVTQYSYSLNASAGCRLQGGIGSGYTINGDVNKQWVYLSTDNITYPSDYGNAPIPQSAGAPPRSDVPTVAISSGHNPRFVAADTTFNTIDDPPFLCTDETAPVLHYQIYTGTDTTTGSPAFSGSISSTGTISITLSQNTSYTLVDWYDCGGDPIFADSTQFTNFYTTGTVYDTSKPDLEVITATGYYLVLHDKNFNTFDDVPFTCESTLTPTMHYEFWTVINGTQTTLLDSGTMSPTIQYTRSLDNTAGNYRFIGWYDCGENDKQFDQNTQVTFGLNEYGGLITECTEDIAGFFCKSNQSLKFGIFSSTFSGIVTFIHTMQTINPVSCNTNWISTAHFTNEYLKVQDVPSSICGFAESNYLESDSPFHTINVWTNVLMAGASVMLLVFGLLAIFGLRVRLPSPIGESGGNDSSQVYPTHTLVSKHKTAYVRGPGDGKRIR